MKVTVEHLPQRQVVLTIEAEAQETQESRKLAYRHIVERAKVPGFRPGKAPMAMVERYAGKAAFLQETIEHLIPDATEKAMEEHGIEPVGQPDIQLVTTEPIAWKATIDLVPLVDLGKYRDIRIQEEPVEATPEEVDASIEELRKSVAPWEPVSRPVAMGDLVTLDMTANDNGRIIGSDVGSQYPVIKGNPSPAPGFPEALAGLSAEESKEFVLVFPPNDTRREVAGKTINFKVTIHEVKAKNLPALDDEFAKSVDEGFDTLVALREKVTAQVVESKTREAKTALETKALQAVIDGAKLEYSPGMVTHEAAHILEDQEQELQRSRVNLDQYLASMNKTREQMLDEVKPVADQRIRRSLVFMELRKLENLEVTDEDLDAEINRMLTTVTDKAMMRRAFENQEAKASLRSSMLNRKSLDRLVAIVTEGAPTTAKKEGSADVP